MSPVFRKLRWSVPVTIVVLWGLSLVLGTTFVRTMPFGRGYAWDSGEYARIQLLGPLQSGAKPPFAFRVFVPGVARLISGSNPLTAFRVLNAISLLVIPFFLLKLARAYGLSRDGPIMLSIALFQLHGLISWYFFCPIMVDLPSFALLLGALYSAKTGRNVIFGLLMILGALSKEFVMWALIYHFALYRTEFRRPKTWFLCFALYAPGIAAFLAVRKLIPVQTQAADYYLRTIGLYWKASASVYGMERLLAGFSESLGPYALLALIDQKAVKAFCVRHWEIPVFVFVGLPFVFIGGMNISLFWFCLFPAFFLFAALACHSLQRPADWLLVLPAVTLAGFHGQHFITGWPMVLKDYYRTSVFWMPRDDVVFRLEVLLVCLVANLLLVRLLPLQRVRCTNS